MWGRKTDVGWREARAGCPRDARAGRPRHVVGVRDGGRFRMAYGVLRGAYGRRFLGDPRPRVPGLNMVAWFADDGGSG